MRKNKDGGIRTAVPRLSEYLHGDIGVVILALVLAALSAVMTIIGPNKIGDMATIMSDGLLGGIDLGKIAKIGIFLAAIYLLSALFGFVQHYIMAVVTLKMSYRMRGELSEKINRVPQKYFNTHTQGDILSRMTNDVSTLQQGLTNSLPTIISAATQFVGCLIMMFATQWRLALISLAVTFVGMGLVVLIMSRSQRFFAARQKSLGELNGFVEEMYSGHEVVRISRAERKVLSHFDSLNAAVYDANWRSQFLSGVMQPLMNIIGNIAYVAVCVVGSILAMNGTIEFGVIVSFILYVRLFTTPLTQIAQGMTNMQTASASAHRIFDFLESEEMADESEKTAELPEIRGKVSFEHVRFSYPDTPDKVIINDFSAEVCPGQKVAIVGPTGAGKTTMVNLLMRFYEIGSGKIKIDGVPITELTREKVHELFSMVLQDTWLFEGTVRENLVYNMQGITDEQLEQVCRACGLDKFVHSLPNGFDTVLSESASISAGQKQLLTIARAMLQNAPMLILDEATSSVDTRTELIIQRAMDELTKGRTSFVIAHRLSTIKNSDLILVMKDGDVIESGTHNELMERGGFYAELYNSQFEQAS
ncbi:ABC transporter ATP-binding protein [Ruminococcus sp. 210702-SL.1.03]|uniref:ABC transporter ATP-binding protein n=1 Tax=Ruminococcus sp. 210702-SL.1.03 TaxID=2883233 RepID=UPI001D073816|nr:ABC transporter ATP-binding protein [Ruminococcus sp. 210702-SL.1.03]MCB6616232.1 ABC transporter ATP-binding protein/permease [Ruminococcus sp. 210702-SL.1.03]